MNFGHFLDNAYPYLFPYILAVALASWLVGYLAQRRLPREGGLLRWFAPVVTAQQAADKRIMQGAMRTFVGMIALLVLIDIVVKSQAHTEIEHFLASEIKSVQINGNDLPNASLFIADMRNMDTSPFRHKHSHPTVQMDVLIRASNGDLKLQLGARLSNALGVLGVLS